MVHPEFLQQQSLTTLGDEEIVERVRHGEIGLYELLMRRYNQRLYRVACSIVRDGEEAEDVMQDAYVRAYEHLDEFGGRARFSTWLTKIAVHEALARVRRRSRVVLLDRALEEDRAMEFQPPSGRNPEDQASGSELSGILTRAVEALPEAYRVVFVLREVEGLSTAEVAESLEISVENVKVRLHRARAALQQAVIERIGADAWRLYAFHLSRCDRVVHQVMQRIQQSPSKPKPV
jgi:RNA polymerase sigma-70 factor (ECF subfamily)